MLPGGPLAKKQLTKLKIYIGDKHPHETQKPKIIDFVKLNRLNIVKWANLFYHKIKLKKLN